VGELVGVEPEGRWFTALVAANADDSAVRQIEDLSTSVDGQRVLVRGQRDPLNKATLSAIASRPAHNFMIVLDDNAATLQNSAPRLTWPANLWLGVHVGGPGDARRRITFLMEARGPRNRFVVCDPLRTPVDLRPYIRIDRHRRCFAHQMEDCTTCLGDCLPSADPVHSRAQRPPYRCLSRIEWVVAGGAGHRIDEAPDPAWYCDIREICTAAAVPFWFRGWGRWRPAAVVLDTLRDTTALHPTREAARDAFWTTMYAVRAARVRHTMVGTSEPLKATGGWTWGGTVMVWSEAAAAPILDGSTWQGTPF
jgi:hypothetical protein